MVATTAVDWAGQDSDVFVSIQYFSLNKAKGLAVEIASTQNIQGNVELLSIQFLSPASRLGDFPKSNGQVKLLPSQYITNKYAHSEMVPAIDLALILKSFSGTILRQVLSAHLMARFISEDVNQPMDIDGDLEKLAHRYQAFTTWNEASPAKYLALIAKVPVERIHTRLKVARRRELIPSLGKGIRVGKDQ